MRHAGAIRIDHIMTLMRLFWISPNTPPVKGAYVHYPFDDLMGILALESERNKCLVIGEDLGTVPEAVRKSMVKRGVFSYKLFYFERTKEEEFKPPEAYRSDAVVSVSTHDLPTLRGYWEGADLGLRKKLNLFPSENALNDQLLNRDLDKTRLLKALEREGLLPEGVTTDPASTPEMTPALSRAIHTLLARTPCKLQMVQLEDMVNQSEQVNMPGTTTQHPNWRRKLSLDLETIAKDSNVISIVKAINRERGISSLKPADTAKG
jgi:(1->4)-alpha-D-glucan 1-alpha-D-glucosylmutase